MIRRSEAGSTNTSDGCTSRKVDSPSSDMTWSLGFAMVALATTNVGDDLCSSWHTRRSRLKTSAV